MYILTHMAFQVVGGLGIFLLGMKNMSDGIQAVAGERLRKLIDAITDNRVFACAVGVIVTAFVQSSSVSTVMVIGLVNAGVMSLVQAVGVILGANIGTTITGWVLVLKIGKFGLPILGVASFFYLFSSKDRIRYFAMLFMGLGMIFFGLLLMKNGFKPIRDMPEFVEWFSRFRPDTFWGLIKVVAVGAGLTAIVQSSSATLAITISLATTGVIGYDTAVALVLGENVGTTITARLASIGGSDNAKRASYAHVMVNVLGVGIILLIFPWYVDFVKNLMGVDPGKFVMVDGVESFVDVTLGIATSHTIFNIVLAAMYLPFINYIVKLLYWLVPKSEKEKRVPLLYSEVGMTESSALAIGISKSALNLMAGQTQEMMANLRTFWKIDGHHQDLETKIFEEELELDLAQKEVVEFLTHLLQAGMSQEIVREARGQLRNADELESIGDYIEKLLKLKLKLIKSDLHFSEQAKDELLSLHDRVAQYLDTITTALKDDDQEIGASAQVEGDNITALIKEYRSNHLKRIEAKVATPIKSLIYTDALNSYRRIKDHALNVAEVTAGEK